MRLVEAVRSLLIRLTKAEVANCSIEEVRVNLIKHEKTDRFDTNSRILDLRKRQLAAAHGRLEKAMKEFGDELVITAKNGNGNGNGRCTS